MGAAAWMPEPWPVDPDDHVDDDTRGEVDREFDVEMIVRVRVSALSAEQAGEYAAVSSANWRDWDVVNLGTVKEVSE